MGVSSIPSILPFPKNETLGEGGRPTGDRPGKAAARMFVDELEWYA
jgi:hypothetical protein